MGRAWLIPMMESHGSRLSEEYLGDSALSPRLQAECGDCRFVDLSFDLQAKCQTQ